MTTSFDIYNRNDQTAAAPAAAPPAGLPSFDIYSPPANPRPASERGPLARLITGEPAPVSTAEDIYKGVGGGLGRGVAGTIGIGGSIGNLARYGLSAAGVPEESIDYAKRVLNRAAPMTRVFSGPDAGQVQGAIERVTGKFYEPQTIPGQYASTIVEYAPGSLMPSGPAGSVARAIAAKTLNTVAPAVTSETAGQLTKNTPYEPWARGVGGLVGGVAGAKLATPIGPTEGAYARAVAALEKEGIPLTAGQRTGSKKLQWTESNAIDMPVVGGQAARIQAAPRDALARAVTERMFDPDQLAIRGIPKDVTLPDSGVFAHGRQSLKDEYDRLSNANYLRSDPQLQRDLARAQATYEANVLPSQRTPDIAHIRNDLVDRMAAGQGRMPGGDYQRQRSRLGKAAKGMQDIERADALRDMRTALDEAMERSLSPADAAAWRLNNRRYANMKQVGVPLAAAGGETISPMKLASAARSGRAEQYAAQQGDLDELADAAAMVMKPLPQSGTAPRMAAQFGGGGAIGTAVGGAIGGFPGAAIGAGVGAALPLIPSYLATSRLGQAYLGNRALPQDIRDVLAQTLAQQAIAQPSSVARNRVEREAYRKKQERR